MTYPWSCWGSASSRAEQPRSTALQAELPALSTHSVRHVVQGATHESLVAKREYARVVADAIRAVAAGDPGRVVAT